MPSKDVPAQYSLPLGGLSQGELNLTTQTGYETEREDAGRAPVQVQRGAQRGGVFSTGGYNADRTAPQD